MAGAVNVSGYREDDNVQSEDELEIGVVLTNFLISLRMFTWLVILLTVVGVLFGFVGSRFLYTPRYETGATFAISSSRNSDNDFGFNTSIDDWLVNSEVYIIQSSTLKNMLVDSLGENYADCEITADALSTTNLVTLTVSSDSKHKAYVAAEQVISDFPKISQKIYGDVEVSLLDEVDVSDTAVNAGTQKKIILAGGALGLLLSLGAVFVYSLNLHLIPDAETLQRYENAECIGKLPTVVFKNKKTDTFATINNRNVTNEFKESFQFIRTRTERYCRTNNARTLLVTSTFPGEGKTTVSINEALSLAQNGKSVFIIDGDLRNPSVIDRMGLNKSEFGLDDFLKGECSFEDAVVTVPHSKVSIMSCKSGMSDVTERLSSDKMKELVEKAKEMADYVIIDSPPTDVMGDSVTICDKYADAAIFVVRQNYGKLNNVIYALDSINQTKAELIGFVLNGVSEKNKLLDYGAYSNYKNYKNYNKYKKA